MLPLDVAAAADVVHLDPSPHRPPPPGVRARYTRAPMERGRSMCDDCCEVTGLDWRAGPRPRPAAYIRRVPGQAPRFLCYGHLAEWREADKGGAP